MKKSKTAKTAKPTKKIPRCWEFEDCPPRVRKSCPAYPDHGTECWKLQGTMCADGRFEHRLRTIKVMHCRNECAYYKKHLRKLNR
jgi:hypothetical protein